MLFENGGGGSSRTWDGNFWVHPLPPDGPVTFVVSWAEHGVAEARAELDGAAIGTAAARAVTLWPEEPDSDPAMAMPGAARWSPRASPMLPAQEPSLTRLARQAGVPSPRTGFSKGSRESQQRSGKGGSTPAEP